MYIINEVCLDLLFTLYTCIFFYTPPQYSPILFIDPVSVYSRAYMDPPNL